MRKVRHLFQEGIILHEDVVSGECSSHNPRRFSNMRSASDAKALYLGALYWIANCFRYSGVYLDAKLFSRTPIQFSSVACDEWVSKKIEVTRVLLL